MSPGEPPRIWARNAASSPAASTCDDFEVWASSTNRSGMGGSSGFRVQGSGFRVQGSGFRVQGSGFEPQSKSFVIPNAALFFVAEGSQSSLLLRVGLLLFAANPSQFDVAPEPISPEGWLTWVIWILV